MSTYYELLGVEKDATEEQIKTRYKELARKYHPDVAEDKAIAHEIFIKLTEAYEVLSDPERRARYDAGYDVTPPQTSSSSSSSGSGYSRDYSSSHSSYNDDEDDDDYDFDDEDKEFGDFIFEINPDFFLREKAKETAKAPKNNFSCCCCLIIVLIVILLIISGCIAI